MIEICKRVIEKEFKANEINMRARVEEYAWQSNRVITYQITLYYGESRKVMTIMANAAYPFKPKLMPVNYIEPHKMIRLCEIIMEAFSEIHRLSKGEDSI